MANQVLGNVSLVSSMVKDNSLLVEIAGSVRRIKLEDFIEAISSDGELILRNVAWGIPIKHDIQSSTNYGRIGNLSLWEEYKQNAGRYLVTPDGKAAKLNPTNSAYYADGTAVTEADGNIMWIGRKLYGKITNDSIAGVPVLWLSTIPLGGFEIGDGDKDHICIGAYKITMDGSKAVSRASGAAPTGSRSISSFWSAAQLNGANWGLQNYDHRLLMQYLMLSEYGNTNVQAVLGPGLASAGSYDSDRWSAVAGLPVGATKNNGDAFANIPITAGAYSDISRVSLMGIEDPYGWQWEMVQGCFCGNSENAAQVGNEVFIYEGNRMPTAGELASQPTGKFREFTRAYGEGYVTKMKIDERLEIFGAAYGGSSTSYWSDYNYNGNTTGPLLLVGGSADNGAYCGLASADSYHAFSYSSSHIGSRLAYYGALEFTEGRNI